MLCPETWRFTPPNVNYKEHTYKANATDAAADNKPSVLSHFNYAHLVSVVLPNIKQAPKELLELLSTENCEYYKVENLSLSSLLNGEFIEKFVKNGDLTALSINTKIDLDNCVCLRNGTLVLNLDRRTYEELGLVGKPSHFSNKYIVQLKLNTLTGTKQMTHVRKALTERLNRFTLIVSWHPHDTVICPSSIAKYFADLCYGVYLCERKHRTRHAENINVPNCDCNEILDSDSDLIEWLGMFSLDADLATSNGEDYVNTYETPEENSLCERVTYLEWRGFFTSRKLQQIFEYLIKYVQTLNDIDNDNNNKIPWISLYVQGFSDAPVSWDLAENHYFTNADNSCAFFLKPNGEYLLCEQKCSNKK